MIKRINNLVSRLKSETQRLNDMDDHSRRKLDRLISELEGELWRQSPGAPEKLIEPLKSAISHFEASHPGITKTMNEIMTTLSGIGI